jgi:hypothetical protein
VLPQERALKKISIPFIRPFLLTLRSISSCLSARSQSSVTAHPSAPFFSACSSGRCAISFPVASRVARHGYSSRHPATPFPSALVELPRRALPPIAGRVAHPRSLYRSPAWQSPASLAPSPFICRPSPLGAPRTAHPAWPAGHTCHGASGLSWPSQRHPRAWLRNRLPRPFLPYVACVSSVSDVSDLCCNYFILIL